MKNRHNFEFSPKTMLILLTVLCILLLSVSTVLKDVMKDSFYSRRNGSYSNAGWN